MTLRSTNSATADGYRKGGTRQTREACSIPRYRYDDVRTGSGDVTNKVLTGEWQCPVRHVKAISAELY